MNRFRIYRRFASVLLVMALCSAGCGKLDRTGRIGFVVKGVETKGPVITTGNIGEKYGSFITDVWVAEEDVTAVEEHSQNKHYIENGVVSYDKDGDPYKWAFSEDKYWLNDVGMCFWSWAPVDAGITNGAERVIVESSNSNAESSCTLDFTYTLPTPGRTSDAVNQKDILFAFNHEKRADAGLDTPVNIHFYHALAWIKFMVDTDAFSTANLDITNICIKNVYSSGACSFKPGESNVDDKFCWTDLKTPLDIGQDFTIAGDFTEPYKTSDTERVTSSEKAFMLIPQTTPDDAELMITFKSGDSTVPRTVAFNGERWLPGQYFLYKITANSLDDIKIKCIVNDWIQDDEVLLK